MDKEYADKTNGTTECSTLTTEGGNTILQDSINEQSYLEKFLNKSKQVIEYMLTIREFSIQDLKGKFSNFGASIIANALYIAKESCIITSIAGGKYRIND